MGCPLKAGYRGLRGGEAEDNFTAVAAGDDDDDDDDEDDDDEVDDGDEDCREGRLLLNSVSFRQYFEKTYFSF